MSNELLRTIIAAFLVIHGIGHSGGYWFFVKSWLSPALAATPIRWLFVGVWLVAMVIYLTAGIALFQQHGEWRALAIVASILSLIVSVLFIQGPALNAAVADVVILVALLVLGWPSANTLGA